MPGCRDDAFPVTTASPSNLGLYYPSNQTDRRTDILKGRGKREPEIGLGVLLSKNLAARPAGAAARGASDEKESE